MLISFLIETWTQPLWYVCMTCSRVNLLMLPTTLQPSQTATCKTWPSWELTCYEVSTAVHCKCSTNQFNTLVKLLGYRTIDKVITCIAPAITDSHTQLPRMLICPPTDLPFTIQQGFYPHDAMLARVFAIATCLDVYLSGRLSHAGIVLAERKQDREMYTVW